MKNVLIPTDELAETMHAAALPFEPLGPIPSVGEIRKYLRYFIEDQVNSRLVWAAQSRHSDHMLLDMFPWYSNDSSDTHQEMFYLRVLEKPQCLLRRVVAEVVKKDSWDIWYVKDHFGNIYLEQSRDYRIVEYERLITSGVIPTSPKISAQIEREKEVRHGVSVTGVRITRRR